MEFSRSREGLRPAITVIRAARAACEAALNEVNPVKVAEPGVHVGGKKTFFLDLLPSSLLPRPLTGDRGTRRL